ncbi:DUF5343 domain-containing protein [Candidatus Parcubacteria bacterium]|nr:DUF5343 domain-containing protein [Candidatus Parcubacteria bacterium]
MNNDEKILTPPYLSVRKIVEMIELVSSRNYPEGISTDFFKSRGFSSADATLAVNTLKFLNLLKEDGTPTEHMEKMRIKGEDRKPEFEKIIRLGYKKLFDTVDSPHELPKDKLETEFIAVYKLSDRIVASAIPAFYRLCMYAGLREEKAVSKAPISRDGSAKPAFSPQPKKANLKNQGVSVRNGFSVLPISGGKFELHLPEEWKNRLLDEEDAEVKWRIARTALKNLADTLSKDSDIKDTEDN